MASAPTQLESLGIEEPYPGMCEDTVANKRVLRANKMTWETAIVEVDGGFDSLLKPHTPETLAAAHNSTWELRKPIMKNPDDRYSDYVGPESYPQDFTDMPWWIQQRLTWWIQVQLGEKSATSKRYGMPFPTRCTLVRNDGTRCWNWATDPSKIDRCRVHAGWVQDKHVRNAQVSRAKLIEASPDLADNMIDLAFNAEGEAVRLKATELGLAIAGVRAGQELNVTVTDETGIDPAATVRERLDRLAKSAAAAAAAHEDAAAAALPAPEPDIVDAEIIETPAPTEVTE